MSRSGSVSAEREADQPVEDQQTDQQGRQDALEPEQKTVRLPGQAPQAVKAKGDLVSEEKIEQALKNNHSFTTLRNLL